MPSIAFLPWAIAEERMRFGAFHVVPLAAAIVDGQVPSALQAAITSILESYGKKRPVDRASVPVIRRDDLGFTTEMSDHIAATYFDFRIRLAFCALAARKFFGIRYWNSDNVCGSLFRRSRPMARAVLWLPRVAAMAIPTPTS